MAIIRKETTPSVNPCTYDAIAENISDIEEFPLWGAGSMIYCLEDQKIYVKQSGGSWKAVEA